jgi:hypothetical protein
MTTLTRPVTREVTTLTGSPLIVTLTAEGIVFREKRRRTRHLLPYGAAFLDAVERHVQAERRRRITDRKVRRAGQ